MMKANLETDKSQRNSRWAGFKCLVGMKGLMTDGTFDPFCQIPGTLKMTAASTTQSCSPGMHVLPSFPKMIFSDLQKDQACITVCPMWPANRPFSLLTSRVTPFSECNIISLELPCNIFVSFS
uniref:Uncharacterized protein n=1 Tax=Micrurus corallinus TaxID=54390 RepID=A0A2D4FAR4_MICCO